MHHHTGADAKCRARGRLTLGSSVSPLGVRGCSSMVEPLPSKQITRVRFPSSAPALGKPRALRQKVKLRVKKYSLVLSQINQKTTRSQGTPGDRV